MEEKGDKKSFQGVSLDEYRREYGFFGEINVLLERLKIEDLFFLDKLDPSDTDAWRNAMREKINISLSYYVTMVTINENLEISIISQGYDVAQ